MSLAVLGLLFRLFLISQTPVLDVFDQHVYRNLAREVYRTGVAIDPDNRTVYYPLIVAGIYKIAGVGNDRAVGVFQAILDTITGFLVYWCVRKLIKRESVALACLALYLFNPITASFTGFILTETVATFLTALLLWSSFHHARFTRGVIIGLWSMVRLVFFPVGVVLVVLLMFFSRLSVLGFGATLLYPWYGQYVLQKKFSVLPVNTTTSRFMLYEGLMVHEWPEMLSEMRSLPPEVGQYMHWNFDPSDEARYKATAQELGRVYVRTILADPVGFIRTRLTHVVRMWNKSHLFFYIDPWYLQDRFALQAGNALFLLASCIGIARAVSRRAWKEHPLFFAASAVMLVGSTLIFSLKPPEERLTVPLYPVLFVFVGFALRLFHKSVEK